MAEKKRCGARTRSGGSCRNWAMPNGRCRLHGGKSVPGGPGHHSYRTGLYSKYAGSQLAEVLAELESVDTEELTNPENEIRLFQALLVSAKALKDDLPDLKDLDSISRVIDRLISAKQRSIMIQIEMQKLVSVEDVSRFLDYLETLLTRRIGSEQTAKIVTELKNFKLSSNET